MTRRGMAIRRLLGKAATVAGMVMFAIASAVACVSEDRCPPAEVCTR